IGRRLRSRTTKPAPAVETTPAATMKTKDSTLKPVKFGPKKSWSKSVPPPEKKKSVLKRKSAPSSDSDFEAEKDASSIKPPTKKAMCAKKAMPQASTPVIEDFPCDNVSFHLPFYAQRWGIICKRRLALERELGKDILECEEVVNLINDARLIKTVWGLGSCYEKLVREFIVNIPVGCDNPLDRKFQKVFVRGKCVEFSPSVINKILGNFDEPHPDFEVSDNVVCKTITANQVKTWPRKQKVPAVKLTQKYAILDRIASVNWVPTTHSSDI
ncbi:putative envelope-like protein, partial [Trifolium pratense]